MLLELARWLQGLEDFFKLLMEELNAQTHLWVATEFLGQDMDLLQQYQRAAQAKRQTGIQARMPFEVRVY